MNNSNYLAGLLNIFGFQKWSTMNINSNNTCDFHQKSNMNIMTTLLGKNMIEKYRA